MAACNLVEEAENDGVILRILGALAVRIHSEGFKALHKRLERLGGNEQLFTDIDFVAYSKQRSDIRKFFEEKMNYEIDKHVLFFHGNTRLIYYPPGHKFHVDVFFDQLEFCHNIYFGSKPKKGRLELDSPTIPLADIILQKTQIHEINEKDIKDIIVLLRAHEIGQTDEREYINLKYINDLLADDWEFWYEVKLNLEKVQTFAKKYSKKNLLKDDDFLDVNQKIQTMLESLESVKKTKKWQKRAKKGPKKQWWRDVEEVSR
ncbi:MAG: hypothetical protein ACE5R6_12960 [Candidatus Heimdallarchaeota archaeon]